MVRTMKHTIVSYFYLKEYHFVNSYTLLYLHISLKFIVVYWNWKCI
jgi:hypothetical protein